MKKVALLGMGILLWSAAGFGQDLKPKTLLIYYGFPIAINQTWSVAGASAELGQYDYIVLGGELEKNTHPDHQNTVDILAHPSMAGTFVFGYIDLGVTTLNYPIEEIQTRVDEWKTAGADGIFFDDFDYGFGTTRARQNAAVDYVHNQGMPVVANAFYAEHAFDNIVDPIFNPDGTPTVLGSSDFYLYESHQVRLGEYYEGFIWQDKANKVKGYQDAIGFKIFSNTTTSPPQEIGSGVYDYMYNEDAFFYAWYSALIYGHEATAWGEDLYSAAGPSNTLAPFRNRPDIDPGTLFTGDILNPAPDMYTRTTDLGMIAVNTSTHTASFSSHQSLADWIISLQYADPALPSYGAVKVHHTVGLYADGNAYFHVVPYNSNLGVVGLLQAPLQGKLEVAEKWIDWYMGHLNPNGTVYDHWYLADGTGETTSPTGCGTPGQPDCNWEDASDSYAATLLGAAWIYYQEGGDPTFLSSYKTEFEAIAGVILTLQQADGLSWAKESYRVKYLMDNSEVYWGLRSMANLEQAVFGDPQAALIYRTAAEEVRSGIISELLNSNTGLYRVAKFENNTFDEADLDVWYPGTVALAWPHLFGVTGGGSPTTQAQMIALNESWDGSPHPDWTTSIVDPTGFPWPSIGHAALLAGDDTRAQTHASFVETQRLPGFDYPFAVDDAGWLLRTQYPNLFEVAVELPDMTARYKELLHLPVRVSDATEGDILAAEVFVCYDGDLLTAWSPAVSTAPMTADWTTETNVIEGVGTTIDTIKIAMATATDALAGEGTLVNVNFTVADIRQPASSALSLAHVLFNDGVPGNATTDGSLTLVGTDGTITSAPGTVIPRWPIQMTVNDADEDRDDQLEDTFDVTVSNGAQSETVTVTETGNSTGVFAGSIQTMFSTGATSGDGVVQARSGDAVRFCYNDLLGAAGNTISRCATTDVIGGDDGEIRTTVVSQPGDTVRVRVTDTDLSTAIAVSVENPRTSEVESILLSETPAADGVFFGRFFTTRGEADGSAGDGVLNVQKADLLIVTYADALTAEGGTALRVDDDEVVDPFGDADGNGSVQAFDAARILLHVLSPFLTGLDSLSANVDLQAPFGDITPFDASLILQKRVGLIERFPVQAPASVNHPQPETDQSVPKLMPDERILTLRQHAGYVSVWMEERAQVVSGELLLEGIDGKVEMDEELSGFLSASRSAEEGLRIVFAGAAPVSGAGELLRVYPEGESERVQLSRATFNDGRIVGNGDGAVLTTAPRAFRLYGNAPNPFNPETTIRYDLPVADRVRLRIYDVTGQVVRELADAQRPAGSHSIVWDGRNERGDQVANSVYLYELRVGDFRTIRKMLLMK